MRLSVIIPTRNRAETLTSCLKSLEAQTLAQEEFEVIVVDNGSTDHTATVARDFSSSMQLVYSRKEEPGLHIGRHEGLRLARADVLVYADDDISAETGWLEAVRLAFADPNVAIVGGNNYPMFEESPPAWLSGLWKRRVYKGHAIGSLSVMDFGQGCYEIDPHYVWGCNFSVRRDVLLRAGGFHPDGFPIDRIRFRGDGETHVSKYVLSSGLRTMFDSRASVHHFVPKGRMTSKYFAERAYAEGISDSYAAIRRSAGVPRLRSRVWPFVRYVKSRISRSVAFRHKDSVEGEISQILRDARVAYCEGYRFHMRETASDPDLMRWVLQESYL